MNMQDCPKYQKCSAPLCPLDLDITKRSYRKGEPICFYMNEFVKPGALARFEQSHMGVMFETIGDILPALFHRYGYIRRRLKRASTTPSRLGRVVGKKEKQGVAA